MMKHGVVVVLAALLLSCSHDIQEPQENTTPPALDDPFIEAMEDSLSAILGVTPEGMLIPLKADQQTADRLCLSIDEVVAVNRAIGEINAAGQRGEFEVEPYIDYLTRPLILAGLGETDCTAKVVECIWWTEACLVGAPLCGIGCMSVCPGSILLCIACITACGPAVGEVCKSAAECWVEARKAGCIGGRGARKLRPTIDGNGREP